ncbi:MAG: DUF1003 domain-containing protein [Pseudomonadota bacterium]|jgi:uncharacterized membrane protein
MTDNARQHLAHQLLATDYDKLTAIQRSVIDLIVNEEPSAVNPRLRQDDRTFGQRLADHVAAFGGSWGFIVGFALALGLWMAWNILGRDAGLTFDPYPFIFLNLMLSTLAAVQAPIILMSQNRAAQRDRKAAEHDYVVNLRAELEIMHLHDKLDALRDHQIVELLERQGEAIRLLRARLEKDG